MFDQSDHTQVARHRVRRVVLTGIAGAVIVGGGGAYAYASGDGSATSTPSAPASGAPATPATPADGQGTATATATAPKHEPHIDGTVTAVSGATVTVEDPDGFTRTIVTSSDTEYDGVSSPLPTGTKIHATGTVADDGTSLDATTISAMPEPGRGGPPAPGQAGKGGPPAPPAGASTAAPSADATPSASGS